MIRIFIVMALCLTMHAGAVDACSCLGPSFRGAVKGSDFVFRAEAVAYGPRIAIWDAVPAYQWLCVRVIDVLKGDLAEKELRLLGDTGALCRRYVTEQGFPLGAEFIFALRGRAEGPTEISSCGNRVRLFDPVDQLVVGRRYSSMTYEEVKELAKKYVK